MKIELEISEEHESTAAPYWLIIDPKNAPIIRGVREISMMITGPFFSRKSAQDVLDSKHYNFSDEAIVYCKSGYYSREYMDAIQKAEERLKNELPE